ncbi:MAG: hypothetical protein IPG04_43220 [Polyangiaceae bacterium]|jgi:hypothetical protein|nr:hypothetical protein [Polyangiaceae bacterium]
MAASPSGRSLARSIQERLEALYGLDAPSVDEFVQSSEDGREQVLVHEQGEHLEIAVLLPPEALEATAAVSLDVYCQVAEGVSHFLYLVERARRGLPATQLELELQAEVDKYVVVTGVARRASPAGPERVRERLFQRATFLHPVGSELGDRYRLATRLASRFTSRLAPDRVHAREVESVRTLRRFFDAGQREKLEMVLAA